MLLKNQKVSLKMVGFFLFTEALMGLGMGLWNLHFNFFLADRGIASTIIGILSALGALVMGVFSIPAGSLADRIGYRWSMFIGCGLKAIGMAMTVAAPSLGILALARIVNGIGDAFMTTCSYPYIMAMVSEERKSFIYSVLFATSMLSMFVGNLFGGFVIAHLGWSGRYTNSLWTATLLVAVMAGLRAFLPTIIHTADSAGFRIYIPRDKKINLYMLDVFLGYAGFFLTNSMLNLVCRNVMGFQDGLIGLIIGISVLMSGVASLLSNYLTRRLGRGNVAAAIFTTLMLSFTAMIVVKSLLFAGLAILTTLLYNMLAAVIDGPMLNVIPGNEQGGFSGYKNLISSIASSVGSAAAGWFIGGTMGIGLIYGLAVLIAGSQLSLYLWGFGDVLEERNLVVFEGERVVQAFVERS